MKKIIVYIDFEAISRPFCWQLKLKDEIPYAYTLGIFVNKQFHTRTYIIDFNNVHLNNIYKNLGINIQKNIQDIIKQDKFVISSETIEFAAFVNFLETKIINKIFENISVIDISEERQISLEKATEREMSNKKYFEELRKIANKYLDKNFIEKRGLDKAGSLAALAGYVLYCNAHPNKKYKYKVNIDSHILLREITNYSQDDVLRMKIVVNDYKLFASKADKWQNILKVCTLKDKKIQKNETIIKKLKKVDPNQTIAFYLKDLNKKLEKIKACRIKKKNEIL